MKRIAFLFFILVTISCSTDDAFKTFNTLDLEFVQQGHFNYENERLASKHWIITQASDLNSEFSNEPHFLKSMSNHDFETHILLISTGEIKTSGGYFVDIQYDGETEQELFLVSKTIAPDGPLESLPIYIPYQVKTYPKTEKTITFIN